jgi:release factor glutamine methyltransferase
MNGHMSLDENILSQFFRLVDRRAKGEPVAYIRGKREFWSREFVVNHNTLIPRPETELLVEHALSFIRHKGVAAPLILDLGTGSGALAVTMAAEVPDAFVIATDINWDTLCVAVGNAAIHNVDDRIGFVLADWLSFCRDMERGFSGFDLVLCNPPYVSAEDVAEMDRNVLEYEPHAALFSDDRGLWHIKALLQEAGDFIRPSGMILCEIGWKQGGEVSDFARSCGVFSEVSIIKDYGGHDRMLKCVLAS